MKANFWHVLSLFITSRCKKRKLWGHICIYEEISYYFLWRFISKARFRKYNLLAVILTIDLWKYINRIPKNGNIVWDGCVRLMCSVFIVKHFLDFILIQCHYDQDKVLYESTRHSSITIGSFLNQKHCWKLLKYYERKQMYLKVILHVLSYGVWNQ